jgi:hypothetical protein
MVLKFKGLIYNYLNFIRDLYVIIKVIHSLNVKIKGLKSNYEKGEGCFCKITGTRI